MRNVLSIVPWTSQDMVAAVIRTIFAQPDAKQARAQLDEVTRMLERSHPKVAKMLHDARRNPRVLRIPAQTLAIGCGRQAPYRTAQ